MAVPAPYKRTKTRSSGCSTDKRSSTACKRCGRVVLFLLLLTHMQASRRTFDMIERREMLPSITPSWGHTIWSGYGGSGKSVEPHSYAARVTDAM